MARENFEASIKVGEVYEINIFSMKYAPSYLAAVIAVLANVLPLIGITVGTEDLTTTAQTLITIVSGLFVMYRQIVTGRSDALGRRV